MSPRSRQPPPVRSVALVLLLSTVSLWAPGVALGEERRLHERIVDPNREAGPLVEQPAEGQNPAALRLPELEVAEPRHAAELRSGEQPFEEAPPPPDSAESHQRLQQWSPDLQTDRTADQLSYHSTFTPSIAPHKRISALDQVEADYTLRLASAALEELAVGGEAQDGRDLFWGSVLVRFVPGRPLPIPSIAPEARILSVRSRPEIDVRFSRDGAGNFYVSSDHAGQVRLVFVTDAPASYFGGPLPGQVRASDVPAELRPSLPANVARAAGQVFARLGLDPGAPIARNLTRLVTYLRAFENEPLEGSLSGVDRYLTLAFGRRGVCRHRAFVFVVTAQGLGIPARFITNEVHAFSEVYVPTLGWVRIDLGGEARLAPESEPTVHHEPSAPDPFPWPPGSRQPREDGQGGHGQGRVAGTSPGEGAAPGVDPTRPGQPGEGSEGQEVQVVEGAPGAETTQSDPDPEEEAPSPPSAPRQLVVYLDQYRAHVVRGEALALSGQVRAEGEAVSGAQVTLWLRSPSGQMTRLGRGVCGEGGRFSAHFAIPGSLPTGDYNIVARAEEAPPGQQ